MVDVDIIASGATEFCDGQSVTLTSSVEGTYFWSPNGETTQSITVTESGIFSVFVINEFGCSGESEPIEVTVYELPEVSTTADGPLTFCDGNSVTLTSSEAEAYSWAPFGQTTQSIIVTESGIYRVTVTDENGCQATSNPISVTVNENPEPVIIADGATEFCEGGSVTLNGPTGFIYSWLPNGETSQSITADESGDYQLVVTDELGCSGESNIITVTEFDVDTATITAQGEIEFCEGGEVTLVASSGVSYEWSPTGETSQSILVTESGFYTVSVVDDNGCETTSDTVEVTVNPLPDATITASGPLEFCEGDSVILSVTAGLGSYTWTPNYGDTSAIVVYESGTYSVIVTSKDLCSAESDPVQVNVFEQEEVEISVSGATEFCDGGQVTLTASTGETFIWSPNGETSPSITVTESGVYTVSITDANGCSYASEDSVEVIVNPNPEPVVTVDGPIEFCEEGSVTLTSTEAESYAWAPNGETTQSITVTESGIYRVTVTDENGCQGTSDPINVTVNELPEVDVTANGPLTICPEDDVTLTSSAADAYLWSPNGETTQSISVSEAGTYSVLVTDANGCQNESAAITVEVFEVEPVSIEADGATVFCEGDSVLITVDSGESFVWSPNGETDQSIYVFDSGAYSVTVEDANGCSVDSDTIEVIVNDLPEAVISLSGSPSFCEGDSVILTVSSGEAYLWEPNGETTESITVFESGSYSVELADANGCTSQSDTIEVEVFILQQVEVEANGATEFCVGGEIQLTALGGTSWSWYPSGETTESITVSESGSYVVSITDANGCESSSDTVEVEVFELPEVEVSLSQSEFCEGDSVLATANATEDVTFVWFENGNSLVSAEDSTLYIDNASVYTVEVTDENGCSASDEIPSVTIGSVPVAVISGNNAACPGDTITLTASGGDFYEWNNGETTPSISMLADSVGTYTVSVSNEYCGTVSSTSINVSVFNAPDALIETNAFGSLEVEHLFSEISDDSTIVYWTWNFGDGMTEDGQSVNNYYTDEGFFTVGVTTENENGCLGHDTVEIEITQVIDIPNVFTPNGDGFNDELFIGNFGVENYEITIYNRWGIIIHHDATGEVFWDGKTPAGIEAEAGTYYYTLDVINPDHSEGSSRRSGTITLIR